MSDWLVDVDAHEGGREKAVVAHFGLVKKSLTEAGKDFSIYVEAPCHGYVHLEFRTSGARDWAYILDRLGLAVAPGSIIWHAMRLGGVRKYLEEAATNVPKDKPEGKLPEEKAAGTPLCLPLWLRADNPVARLTRRTQVPETVALPTQRLPTPPPEVTSAGPSQSSGSPSQRRSFVPGSIGDEASNTPQVERQTTDVEMVEPPPTSAQPTSTAKRVSLKGLDCGCVS